ncbi:MAG: hypothetical protein HIU82_13935 [Proteobacteria bacterium]|nr:hypothetical protein [Pseudomonadota bacterium]
MGFAHPAAAVPVPTAGAAVAPAVPQRAQAPLGTGIAAPRGPGILTAPLLPGSLAAATVRPASGAPAALLGG